MSRRPLRVVVADDERPARSFLVGILGGFEDVELVGEAATGAEALDLIERERPDLALLDLQMPELDGLAVVRRIPRNRMPFVAFVTAHDEHAVEAFDLNAVDYLLKPVERARLRSGDRIACCKRYGLAAAQQVAASQSFMTSFCVTISSAT